MSKSIYNNFGARFNGYNCKILKETQVYTRTASGKSWKSRPETVESETVDREHYINYVESIPFFNNWGNGASCRAVWNYTAAGYIPVKVTTVSPYQEEKHVTRFRFIYE